MKGDAGTAKDSKRQLWLQYGFIQLLSSARTHCMMSEDDWSSLLCSVAFAKEGREVGNSY